MTDAVGDQEVAFNGENHLPAEATTSDRPRE